MVAHLIRLRLQVLANTLKRSVWQVVAIVICLLYGLGALLGIIIGLVALSAAPLEFAQTVIVLGGSVTLLGWVVIPVFTTGIDQTLDPVKLARFPIPRRQLFTALTAAGLVGIPGAMTLIGALATAGTWWRYPVSAGAALICASIGAITCVVASRMTASISSFLGTNRRYREFTGLLLFVPLILLGPIITGLTNGIGDSADALPRVARTLSWTPLGAVWAVPGELAQGHIGEAALKFVIGAATLGVFVLIWQRALSVVIESPPHSITRSRGRGKLGLIGLVPATPTWAVAARSLTYWIRDPRYTQQLITVPLVPILFAVTGGTTDLPGLVNAAGPMTAFLFASAIYADVSYDSTAFATHIAAGVTGRADRCGRIIALASFAVPTTVLITVGGAWYSNSWTSLPMLLGISLGVLLSGIGLSSVISARIVFPVPEPGESPFKSKPGAGLSSIAATFALTGALVVLVIPELVFALVALLTGNAAFGWACLVTGIILGIVFLLLGIRIGGRMLDARAPDLLAQLVRQP